MISVVLVAAGTENGPAALLPVGAQTLLDHTVARLERLGAPALLVVAPAEVVSDIRTDEAGRVVGVADLAGALAAVATALADARTEVALVAGELMEHDEAAAELLLDPRRRTAAAVSGAHRCDVRRRAGRVVSAGSAAHTVTAPDAAYTGALVVGRADLAGAAQAVRSMAQAAADAGWCGDPSAYVLVALVRSGVPVAAVDIDPWPWSRPASADEADRGAAAIAAHDAGELRLTRALRPDDGFYSTFVVRRLSRRMTPFALRWGLPPNLVTVASLLIGLAAAGCFAGGSRGWLVAGALLLQLSLAVDCVDGEVARYTRSFSSFGAWLDASTDRIKEYACYAGLAVGYVGGGPDIWLLAAATLTLQTTRHTSDYTFTLVSNVREGAVEVIPLDQPHDRFGPADQPAAPSRAWLRWGRKAIHMPIGERWFVLSATALLGSARWVFTTLLTLGLGALTYTTTSRVLRSRRWADVSATDRERAVIRAQLDRGPLASALARALPWRLPVGRFVWLVPPALRLLEYGTVIVVVRVVAPDAMPAAFALLFAVAYHHYDALYRVLNGLRPVGAVHAAGLGVEGRLLVVLVLAASGEEALSRGLVVLAAALAVLFVGVGTLGGWQALRSSGGRVRFEEAVNA